MSKERNFGLKYDELEILAKKVNNYVTSLEDSINEYLKNSGKNILIESMTNFIPVSKKNKQNHAKFSTWYEVTNPNLGLIISNNTKGKRGTSYYYLYYLVTGTGTSKNKGINDFLTKGFNKKYDVFIEKMLKNII